MTTHFRFQATFRRDWDQDAQAFNVHRTMSVKIERYTFVELRWRHSRIPEKFRYVSNIGYMWMAASTFDTLVQQGQILAPVKRFTELPYPSCIYLPEYDIRLLWVYREKHWGEYTTNLWYMLRT